MISVETALDIIKNNSTLLTPRVLSLLEAQHHVLAEDCISMITMPPFRQSAMDGYALHLTNATSYQIIDEVKAGDAINPELQEGEGVRIFTGARVPDTATTVIMQEKTEKSGTVLTIPADTLIDKNIRPAGEQIKKGAVALPKGTRLNAAAIGFLTGLGITEVTVYPSPKIGIVVTGNELVAPGQPLPDGKIYESNYIQLHAALTNMHITGITKYMVKDDYQSTEATLQKALQENEVLLVSGGISVGDYDFVGKALRNLKTQELFYKVKQKPGKPLFFGKRATTTVFALPGNPASSLTCFYIHVVPLLHRMMGIQNFGLPKVQKQLINDYQKKGERAEFLKAYVENDQVTILDGQSSAMLNTYALANALVYFPVTSDGAHKNQLVECMLLP